MDKFARDLLAWFDHSGRHDLPWQRNVSPYRVWVSEIMLQQTQVNTVIPYYLKFIASFPDVPCLAKADEDKVLHHWTGLGYYARARNLHTAAKILMRDFNAELPSSITELVALPGIGRSTAGAILAIAMNKSATILDGNVKRVLARFHQLEGWTGNADVVNEFWRVAEGHIPGKRVADYTQAIMDLGATICTRNKPACDACPLRAKCLALKYGTVAEFPQRKQKRQLPVRSIQMLIFELPTGEIHLEKRPPQGVWGSLWSFPEAENDQTLEQKLDEMGASRDQIESCKPISPFRHTFSHFHLDIHPVHVKLVNQPDAIGESGRSIWYDPDNPAELGLAAPVKRLLNNLRGTS